MLCCMVKRKYYKRRKGKQNRQYFEEFLGEIFVTYVEIRRRVHNAINSTAAVC